MRGRKVIHGRTKYAMMRMREHVVLRSVGQPRDYTTSVIYTLCRKYAKSKDTSSLFLVERPEGPNAMSPLIPVSKRRGHVLAVPGIHGIGSDLLRIA